MIFMYLQLVLRVSVGENNVCGITSVYVHTGQAKKYT